MDMAFEHKYQPSRSVGFGVRFRVRPRTSENLQVLKIFIYLVHTSKYSIFVLLVGTKRQLLLDIIFFKIHKSLDNGNGAL